MAKRQLDEDPQTSQSKVPKLGPFERKGEHEDEVTLRFDDGKELYASSAFLKVISPVFQAMLEQNFKEKQTGVVELKGKKVEDFLDFLHLCHSTEYKPVNDDNVYKVMPLAEEYQVCWAIDLCKNHLQLWFNEFKEREYLTEYTKAGGNKCKSVTLYQDHFKDLECLLTILSFASKYSHAELSDETAFIVAKYPCCMYLPEKVTSSWSFYGHSIKDNNKGCVSVFNSMCNDGKVAVFEKRLMKPFNA